MPEERRSKVLLDSSILIRDAEIERFVGDHFHPAVVMPAMMQSQHWLG